MEANRFIRKHEKTAITSAAEEARRLAPQIKRYGGLTVDCADGITRPILPETSREYGERLAGVGMEYGFRMSLTDGMPVPTEHTLDDV